MSAFKDAIAALTEEQFKVWLKAQPDDREFRYPYCDSCLVASFVRECSAYKEAHAGGRSLREFNGGGEFIDLPVWLLEKSDAFLRFKTLATAAELKEILL